MLMPNSDPGPDHALTRCFVRRTWYVFATAGLLFVAWQLADVALLAFAAVIVAVMLRSVADPIRDHSPLGEGASLLVGGLIILGLLFAAGWLFGSTVSAQISDLVARLPKSPDELRVLLERLPLGDEFARQVTDMGGLASRMQGVAGRISGYAMNALGALTSLVLVLVAGVYLASKPRQSRDGLLLLLPKSTVEPVREALDTTGRALRRWLLGTFADMAVVAVLTAIGAALIGLPSPLALALFAGLASFVPIVGPIVAIVPATLLALQQGPEMVLWTILVYVAVQQIESNLILPFIQKRAVDMPPTLTLFGVFGFGILLGPLGVIFATPLLVAGIVFIKLLYVRRTLGKQVSVPGEHS
jgi:predicted PurR-regulated permease PerM